MVYAEKVIIIYHDPESAYYREIKVVNKELWSTKPTNHWYYWRKATIFEQELYLMGVRELELPF